MTRSVPRTHALRAVAAIGVAGLALTACGSSGGATTSGTSASTAPAASSSASASPKPQPTIATTADGVLTLGTLLPQTGNLAFLGPPEFAGVNLAVKEINAAGGVLGKPVKVITGDSGDTSTDIATQTVQAQLRQNVDAIIGAASSGVSFTVIDSITGSGVIEISPANTSPKFTDYNDRGLYFRTAPSDVLQGRVLGNLVVSDGHANVAIMALNDPYGTGLADNVEKAVTGGGGKIVQKVIYDPQADNFGPEVDKVAASKPDAIVLIGFDESAKIISSLIEKNIGPAKTPLYLVDGNTGNALGKQLPAGALTGVKGTIPGAATSAEFKQRLLAVDPKLVDYSYAPESYDAAIVVALATEAAGTDGGTAIAAKMQSVTEGGTKCTSFKECSDLLKAKKDINYDGVSGPITFSDKGDPTEASIGIYTFGADNKLKTKVDYIFGKI